MSILENRAGMSRPSKLAVERITSYVDGLPADIKANWGRVTYMTATAILRHFLGQEWIVRNVWHTEGVGGYLRLDFSSDERRELRTFRLVELAENLINLQHVEGFDSCILRMRQGKTNEIEATCAELDIGRFLYIHDIEFRFVVPEGIKLKDYDFEVVYPDGVIACADAKCRLESTDINSKTIRNTLDGGRKQLPPDRPGILFVKIPQSWLEIPTMQEELQKIAEDFLRGTQRVVSVKFYVSLFTLHDGVMMHRHWYKEISNPRNKFDPNRNWGIFRIYPVTSAWNGMPRKWHRIFFHDGARGEE
jgi:hypothetical protein